MGRRFELFGFTIVLAIALGVLTLELSQPTTAAAFMWTLGEIDWPVVALMAPHILAGAITLVGSALAVRAILRVGRPDWRWMAGALVVGPIVGWVAHLIVGSVVASA